MKSLIQLLYSLIICIIFFSCKDDDVNHAKNYKTPTDVSNYIESVYGHVATLDKNGSAIKRDELVIQFVDSTSHAGFSAKEQYLYALDNSLGQNTDGLITNVTACMCGDELLILDLDAGITQQLGGVEEVGKKIEVTSGGIVETTPNYIVFSKELNNQGTNNSLNRNDFGNSNFPDVLIAVLDTGFDLQNDVFTDILYNPTSQQFADNCLQQYYIPTEYSSYDLVDKDNYPDDEHSHGTHVQGIINNQIKQLQNRTNGTWSYKFLPVRTHDDNGLGTYFNVLCGTYYSVKMGADVINDSWGFYGLDDNEFMKEALLYAKNHQVMVVTALGNHQLDVAESEHVPSNFDYLENVLSVAAFEMDGNNPSLADFSNYNSNQRETLIAPGKDVISIVPSWHPTSNLSGQAPKSGTSMAAPHITASVATQIAQNPSIPFQQIKEFYFNPSLSNQLTDNRYGSSQIFRVYTINHYY